MQYKNRGPPKRSTEMLQTGISICVAMSLHNLFLRWPHLSHYIVFYIFSYLNKHYIKGVHVSFLYLL